jgi:PAS domain S-box-containing protein
MFRLMPDVSAEQAAPDAVTETEVRRRLARMLVTDGTASEIMHVLLATVTGVLIWTSELHEDVLTWVSVIVVAAIVRFLLRRRASRAADPLRDLTLMRLGTLWIAAAWAAGLLTLGRTLPLEPLALVIIMMAGIVSGANTTLQPDFPSFAILLAGLLGPLAVLMRINPHVHSNIGSFLILTYALSILIFFRRSRASLIARVRTTMDLERATADAHAARDAERNLARIIEATPDHVGIADASGRMRYMNTSGRAMVGIDPHEDISRYTVMDLTPPRLREWVSTTLQPLANRDGWWSGESALQHRDGSEIPVSLVTLVHRNDFGEIDSVSAIARDIREQAETRDKLMAAREAAEQATSAKSAFLANTSHEIRTPLNGVLGMVELLLDTDLSPSQRRSVEVIASSGETLLHTIDDLLDFSKIEAGQLDVEIITFDLHQLINSTTRLFVPRANAKGLELVCDLDAGIPQHVRGDPHRIRQVLSNLLSNAIKFTATGEVVLTARPDRSAREPSVTFAVRDTGIGIRPDQVSRVFEAFRQGDVSTTRKYGGTGLGLSIAKRLVELMGGSLAVDSTPGQGSEFRFTLPLPRSEDTSADPRPRTSMNGVRVLVVDDHPTNRRVLGDMLRWAGGDVDEVADAASALSRLREAAKRHLPYHLVLSDVQMPVRDGFGLAKDVLDDPGLRDTRVMLLTSAGQRGDAERCRELGVSAYLQKPVLRVELIDAALAALGTESATALVTRNTIEETRRRLRILLAEDNPVNQEVAVAMLRKRGHEVVIANNGLEAVNAVRRDGHFDVVLMDLQMPELDGFEATEAIRAGNGAAPPIVALTANTSPGERERCIAAGMSDYLAKPFKPHELFAVVEGWRPREVPVAATPDAGAPPVDLERFRSMLQDAGIPETGPRMIAVYLSDTPPRMLQLVEAAQAQDADTVMAIAHRLKSGSASLCAVRLAALLERAEGAAATRSMNEMEIAVLAAEREYERVVEYLKSG